ncbi:unnamed protein product [Musa hybrid cultivar]
MKPGEEEEMSSDCSSGCQSGWTAYLEDEEEDLSMVSDASSGPPQLREEDEQRCRCQRKSNLCVGKIGCLCPVSAPAAAAMARDGCKKRRVGEEQHIEHSSVLVDTATSPLFGYSKACFDNNYCYYQMKPINALDFTRSFSSAHLEESSALQKQIGYLQTYAPLKPTSARPVSRKERKTIW